MHPGGARSVDPAACVSVIRSTARHSAARMASRSWSRSRSRSREWLARICINIADTCLADEIHSTPLPFLTSSASRRTCYDILIIYLDKRVGSPRSGRVPSSSMCVYDLSPEYPLLRFPRNANVNSLFWKKP